MTGLMDPLDRTQFRLAFLAEAGRVFAGSLEISTALADLARLSVTFLADICLVDLLEDGVVRRVAAVNADPDRQPSTGLLMSRFAPALDGSTPVAEVLRTGRTRWASDLTEDFLRRTTTGQEHFALLRELDFRSFVSVPLVARERVVGALTLVCTAARRRFEAEDVLLVEELAGHAALAIDNARLYEATRRAREIAEQAADRLAFLARASEVLARSLDPQVTLKAIARVVVPTLADWCTVDMLEEGGTIRQTAVAHVDPSREPAVRELRRRYPPDPALPHPVWAVLGSGAPDFAPLIREEDLAARAVDQDHLRLLHEVGIASHLVVPMPARGRIVGAISFVYGVSGRRHTEYDLSLAEDLARRAALAIDNARLYRDQLHIARTLQASLLPPSLPSLHGLEIAARYRAAGSGVEVGGDFYDAFEAGGGALVAAIGDVCGRGPEAAAVTGLARHTLRAASLREQSPAAILRMLNDAVLEQSSESRFCTVCCVRLQGHPDGSRLLGVLATGGHPLPVLIRADGAMETVGTPGMVLGLFPEVMVEDRPFRLDPGDALVFTTDGITDRRAGDEPFGPHRLGQAIASGAGGSAEELAGVVESAVDAFAEEARDDSAILVIRYAGWQAFRSASGARTATGIHCRTLGPNGWPGPRDSSACLERCNPLVGGEE